MQDRIVIYDGSISATAGRFKIRMLKYFITKRAPVKRNT